MTNQDSAGRFKRLCRAILLSAVMPMVPGQAQDYSTTILAQSPVGYWRLEESVQPVRPNFTAANLGTLGASSAGVYDSGVSRGQLGAFPTGGATSSTFSNPGLVVTYLGPVVNIPHNPALNPSGPFSVEFWARPSGLYPDLYSPVCSLDTTGGGREGFLFYAGPVAGRGTVWQFRMGNAVGYTATVYGDTVQSNTWHHIVATYDGASAILYVNGTASAPVSVPSFSPNLVTPLRIGATTIPNRTWDGGIQDVAFYSKALSGGQVASHFNTGLSNGAAYPTTVLADNPTGYWRLGEAPNVDDPVAANLGSLGSAGDGAYRYGTTTGQAGPAHSAFPGFPVGNKAVGLNGTNGYVSIPGLNLNTNELTLSAWVYSAGIQNTNVGIVFTHTTDSSAGLATDLSDPNGLAYDWNGQAAAVNFKSSLVIPDSTWSYVALTVRPDTAVLVIQDATGFYSAVNYDALHDVQPFIGEWRIGNDANDSANVFNGLIDEVAIFNRALTLGELYTQYSSAAGNLAPRVFSDATGPNDDVSSGDVFTVTADVGGTPPLSYQWKLNGSPIPGGTSPTFGKAATVGDTGDYSLTVSNATGSTTTAAAHVNVINLSFPSIITQPVGRVSYVGGSHTFKVVATGGQLTYQWSVGGLPISGATNTSLSFNSLVATNSGSYTVAVKNSLGTIVSAPATLQVSNPAAGSFESIIVGDKPESWWRLNDPQGTAVVQDAMGRHDGQYVGLVSLGQPSVGIVSSGGSALFDGSASYGTIPYSALLNPKTNFTVEGWVKANLAGIELTPFSSFSITGGSGRGYGFLKTAGDVWWGITGNNDQYNYYYADLGNTRFNEWTHLAIVNSNRGTSFYVNGVFVDGPFGNYIPNASDPFILGGRSNGGKVTQYWSGQLAEVAFYRSALTDSQIAAHYQSALYGNSSAPVFIDQPVSQTVIVGQSVIFAARVEGTTPLSLQWMKDTQALAGETNQTLTISKTDFGSIGHYTLVASNAIGSKSSQVAALSVVPVPVYANFTNDLVLHLPLDAEVSDTSGRGNSGTISGQPTFVTGVIGSQALHYSTDTTNNLYNYVSLGLPSDLQFSSNVNFSVSFWVRLPKGSLSGDLPFLCNAENSYSNPGFTFAPSYQRGGWSWSLGDANIYGPNNSINDGKWHHLVFTFDRATVATTYLDGDEVDSRPDVGGGDLDTGSVINIGQDPTGTYSESGEADLDDMGIWRRVLTPYEVSSIYLVGSSYGVSFDSTTIPANATVSLTLQPNAGGTASIYWSTGQLQSSDNPTGPWQNVPNGTVSPYVLTPTGTGTFFRVTL